MPRKKKLVDPEKTNPSEQENGDLDVRQEPYTPRSAYESPNRVVLPRKIGRRRPEDERGYKPTVI